MAKRQFKLKNKNIRANTEQNFKPTNDVQATSKSKSDRT